MKFDQKVRSDRPVRSALSLVPGPTRRIVNISQVQDIERWQRSYRPAGWSTPIVQVRLQFVDVKVLIRNYYIRE